MTEGTAAGLVGVSGLVTFVSGNWYFGSFSEAGLTLVADEAIVEAAGSVGRSRGHRLRARRAGAGRWLSPVLPVTLRVDEGGLSLPGAGGARCPVGAPEARLLVHCVRAGALLSSTLGPNERGAAASLVTAGVLTYLDHAPLPSPSDGTVDSAPEPAGRPGRLLASRALDDPRIPVVGAYVAMLGPPLALGMLLAHGRVWNGGRLNEHFDLARPLTHDEARQFFDGYRGPAVLLCSNYLWSLDANLGLAAELKAANPELIVVHGGPSTPKYEQESAGFLARPEADILVLGEGEVTLAEVLGCLASSTWGDVTGLLQIPGVVVTDPETGLARRTVPRDRIVDLDTLPSPYLTGEFDDLDPEAWNPANGGNVVLETNRGCPYKCTFCDWGSATLSRIRKFGIDRVFREIDWLGERGVGVWMLADANFGILPRDREIAGLRRSMPPTPRCAIALECPDGEERDSVDRRHHLGALRRGHQRAVDLVGADAGCRNVGCDRPVEYSTRALRRARGRVSASAVADEYRPVAWVARFLCRLLQVRPTVVFRLRNNPANLARAGTAECPNERAVVSSAICRRDR
jgi:hypothetical protein